MHVIVRNILIFVAVCLTGLTTLAFYMLALKVRQLEELKGLFADLQGVSGFDNIIKVIEKKILEHGEVVGFLKRSKDGEHLEGSFKKAVRDGKDTENLIRVSLLEPSAPTNAFYNLKPCGFRRKSEADKALASKCGWDITFIPIAMKGEGVCWKVNNCVDKTCLCFRKSFDDCWLRSDRSFRGSTLKTYQEKAVHCLSCKCFLPVGVFAVKGGDPHKINDYLRDTFSGLVKGSVLFDQAVDSSTRDGLTNLLNKRAFKDSLNESIALHKRTNRVMSLCMFDIDHFKSFNDTYGHPDGDKLLHELSSLLVETMRQSDICARYGGEEFVIIYPETDKGSAFAVAEKFRSRVANHSFLDGRIPPVRQVTISMGVASFLADADSPEELIEKADKALYHAKKTTRNAVAKYSVAMERKE